MNNIEKIQLGKTYISRSYPWGLNLRNGHRLLCSDGVIRAAELAESPDTFFSTPATVRVNGKTVSGYMTIQAKDNFDTGPMETFVFRHHTCHNDTLPEWPCYDNTPATPEEIAAGGMEPISGRYRRVAEAMNATLANAHS